MMNSKENVYQITPQSIIHDLLEAYPFLEDKLIETAPVFVRLKNPVLRRTITKITTLRQAAVIGNVQVGELVNKLRVEAGQPPLATPENGKAAGGKEVPDNILSKTPVYIYDAREDLEKGVHPLARVMKDVSLLKSAEIFKLITSFVPAPLIAKIEEKGFNVWTRTNGNRVETYIEKR